MRQEDCILNYLQAGNGITSLTALQKFGCFRLAVIIFRLRKRGYSISTTMIKNMNGNYYAYYKLNKNI